MSKEPWAITSTKRKAQSATPAPRKRPRCHDVESKDDKHTINQQTLTQVQWVTPVPTSFERSDSLEDIPQPRTARSRKLKKRNSTLTQMDFFSFPPPDHDDLDDDMMLPTQQQQSNLPQLDGSYESPRRPRKRKSIQHATARPAKRKSATTTLNSQEYLPRRKGGNKSGVETEQSVTPRRVSSRIASRQALSSDAAENLRYFQQALGIPEASRRDRGLPRSPAPLEIKDSVDEGEEIVFNDSRAHQSMPLRTPEKSRMVILSSQSPESLPPSTRRSKANTFKANIVSLRTPLAERSVNYSLSPSKGTTRKLRGAAKRSPGKGKVVVLKLPKRKPFQPRTRTDNHEAGLWSIPSSSPQLRQLQVDEPQSEQTILSHASGVDKPDIEPEIPGTSQGQALLSSPLAVLTQDSLPDLADIVGSRGGAVDEAKGNTSRELDLEDEESPVLVRDFAVAPMTTGLEVSRSHTAINKGFHDEVPLDGGADGLEGDLDVDEVDFGSPIANDTQFNFRLENRISSPSQPSPAPGGNVGTNAATPRVPSPTPHGHSRRPSTIGQSLDEEIPPQTPLPRPRLVESPCKWTPTVQGCEAEDPKEVALPTPALMHHSSTVVSITKVPLNDTLQQSSSSSPPLFRRATTQKSIHPASIPHPSQISTQEATQASPIMSSYPQRHDAEITQRPDQITIKDSSSIRVPLSQLPQYTGNSQSQYNARSGIDEVLDSEDEGDLDLDPSSLPSPPRKTPSNDRELIPPRGSIDTIKEEDDHYRDDSQNVSQLQTHGEADTTPIRSSQAISISSSPSPAPLQREYSPIPGFNNETQSNFTQNGHVTAAYIHRQREAGNIPKWYVPQPYQVPGYTRRN
ncbi:hypothetical protein PV08_10120 [Exophiala spinifera]|uniref:Uncharacterized protein n=1 Tax=Exophiala spinifera TaxID=91928 RepID=A0A0D1Y7D1_9EURO|nr:uncharacterized protein PV08_10120 [Exophiala spinifera]KIW10821.1 hypothetical protein PV08_10120 [Exophiala spinifera]